MLKYSITFAKSARRELEILDSHLTENILKKIEFLTFIPRPRGCKKLEGEENLWRIRLGDYRIVYYINEREKIIDIVRIRHRKDVYK